MPAPDKKWSPNAERDLCLAIILGGQEGERTRHNWPKVYDLMTNLGYSFTKDAISQHFTKTVMREFKARHGTVSLGSSPAPTSKKASTPRKRATPGSHSKSKVKIDLNNEEAEDDDEVYETPSKKVKREGGLKPSPVFKTENSGSLGRERSATVQNNDVEFKAWLGTSNDA
ncbi:hypothetical protein AK830_g9353 [Neonectria ditissima]|uniref:Uncharacterized protein n=1 Tax=Neonectria ditissima TaxID=78410 RepID=A0A0P7BCI0_9HYPO|nr:hypothetical protein AK830_g9353 [Neonectria ditissima]